MGMLNGPIPATRREARHHAQAVRELPANALLQRLTALPAAGRLLEALSDAEDVYLVGGAVRDLIMGDEPLDLDLVVDGELEPVARRLGTPARVHDRFETRTVRLDGATLDLARARRESYEHPGALPTVGPAGIDEDLSRRDFTVNAMALGLSGPRRGLLLEVPHAREDLDARRLRVLHNASFIDDPTRLLRLARYAGRLGFTVEEDTRALAVAAVAAGAPATVSGPRIGAELRLLAEQANPIDAFRSLHGLGIDDAIAPGFGIGTDERAETARHALSLLPADGSGADLLLAVAGLDLPAGAFAGLLERLAFTAARRDRIVVVATRAGGLAQRLAGAREPSQIAAAVGTGPVELVALAGAMGAEPAAVRWLEELRHVALEIDGSDLLAAGLDPGPAVGAGLAAARAAKLDGRANGHEAELAEALRAARAYG